MMILVIEQEQRGAEETICVHKKARVPFLGRWKDTRAEEKTMTNVKNARSGHILNVCRGGGGGGGGVKC